MVGKDAIEELRTGVTVIFFSTNGVRGDFRVKFLFSGREVVMVRCVGS